MANQLPQGWKEEELEALSLKILSGGTPSRAVSSYYGGNIPWVKTGEVQDCIIYDTDEKITEEGLKNSSAKIFPKNTLLIALYGATAAKLAILAIDAATNQACCGIHVDDNKIFMKYVYYYLFHERNNLLSLASGAGQQNLNVGKIKNYHIAYPTDKEEQQYIVDTLDAVAEMIRLRKETIQLTKDLIPSIFQEMFGDPITNPKGWKTDKLGNKANVIGGGTPQTSQPSFWNGNIPWITPKDLSNLNSMKISQGERFITKEGLKNSSAEILPIGTVLFTSRAPIGYLAIAKNSLSTNQGFKSFVCGNELNPIYLLFYLEQIMDLIKSMASGATFKEISGSTAKQIPVLCPPLPLQQEFAAKVEQINENLDIQRKDLDRLQELFDQLLQKAFTGKLTRGEAIDGVI